MPRRKKQSSEAAVRDIRRKTEHSRNKGPLSATPQAT